MEKIALELKPLLKTFFPFAWMGHLGLGLTYGLMGPAQPYLARYVVILIYKVTLINRNTLLVKYYNV